jgi:hypothetical protein
VISIVYYLIYGIIKNIVVVSFLFTNKNDPVTCLQSLFGTNMLCETPLAMVGSRMLYSMRQFLFMFGVGVC